MSGKSIAFILLILCFFSPFPNLIFGQQKRTKDSLLYLEKISEVESLYRSNKKKEAQKKILEAMKVAKRSELHQFSVRAATYLASYESYDGDFLRTFAILDSLESLIPSGIYDYFTEAIIYDAKAIHLGARGSNAEAITYSRKVQEAMRKANRLTPAAEAALKGNDADSYYKLGLYQKSLFLALEAKEIMVQEERLGQLRNPNFSFCITYNNISEVYLALGNVDKSLEYALLARERYDKIGYEIYELKQRNQQVYYKALLEKGEKTKALKVIQDRYETILSDNRKNINERLKAILDLADYYNKEGDTERAKSYFSLAETTIDSISINKEALYFAYAPIIKNHLDAGKLKKADAYLKIALGDFEVTKVTDPKNALSRDYDFFVKLLSYKAKFFAEKYQRERKQEFLLESINWYKSVYYYVSFVSQRLGTQLNPKASSEIETITSDFLSLLLKYEKQFPEKDEWITIIANTMDFVKSFNLQYNLNRLKDIKVLGIPKSLFEKEEKLKNQINILSYKIQNGSSNAQSIEKLNQKLTLLDTLTSQIKKKYPKYAVLNYYEPFRKELTDLTNRLYEEELTISYYYDSNFLYTLVLGKTQRSFFKTKIATGFENLIDAYVSALKKNKSIAETKSTRKRLYDFLLEPIEMSEIKRLVIIPYKKLYKLPFEVVNELDNLKATVISYDFSLFRNENDDSRSRDRNMLMMAPVFFGDSLNKKNNRKSYAELIHSLEEIEEIGKIFDANALVRTKATGNAFLESLDYDIIHLATHVEIDKEAPLNSKIIFSKNNENDKDVTLGEIYNAKILSDMVVLSACETGVGKREKGFGVKSMANGFFYAGAKSVVMSLWQVDDLSTSVLMKYFYQNLKKGDRKDIALQKAKLQYLANTEEEILKHPYYWAGFIVAGDTSPIVETQSWFWLFTILIIIPFAVFFRNKLTKIIKRV
ncbi:CHAT domain-containing protein [Flavobacteriaceae bacterium M23B6Z8]